jgi:hypothetical protein
MAVRDEDKRFKDARIATSVAVSKFDVISSNRRIAGFFNRVLAIESLWNRGKQTHGTQKKVSKMIRTRKEHP